MSTPFKVICLNNSDRPNEIPSSKWPELHGIYTVVKVDHLNMQKKLLGYQLAEVDLSGCFPYLYFAAQRFAIIADDLVKTEKEVEELVEV